MINEQIRDREVRLIGEDGQLVGIMSSRDAYKMAQDAGLDKIDNKLGAINTMIQNGAKTNQVFNQVFEYLAEWVDNAGAQITSISDKVETLDDIGQIKVMLEDLKAEAEDNSDSAELIEALSNVFDKQAKKIASLEAKLDRVIVETTINNKKTIIGSYHFVFEDEGCTVPEGRQEMFDNLPEEYSHLYLAIEDKLAAVICIEDPVRPEAKEVISSLKELGISKVVMMTGDSERTAKAIAGKVGVDEYYSEVLPEDKASFVEKEKAAGRKVIMIGDGINDSPALSAADVGIAISDGAQIAREIADITVSADDLGQIVYLKDLSNNLIKKINRNYRTIVSFNSGLIALGVLGVIQPTTSALLHNTSTLFISMNSMKNITLAEEHK